ncbi:hypothetical protein ACLB2K_068449 [Fragaria x ananassa]
MSLPSNFTFTNSPPPKPIHLHQFTFTNSPTPSPVFVRPSTMWTKPEPTKLMKLELAKLIEARFEYEEQRLVVVGPDPVGDALLALANGGALPWDEFGPHV